jgi:hypothetical protein
MFPSLADGSGKPICEPGGSALGPEALSNGPFYWKFRHGKLGARGIFPEYPRRGSALWARPAAPICREMQRRQRLGPCSVGTLGRCQAARAALTPRTAHDLSWRWQRWPWSYLCLGMLPMCINPRDFSDVSRSCDAPSVQVQTTRFRRDFGRRLHEGPSSLQIMCRGKQRAGKQAAPRGGTGLCKTGKYSSAADGLMSIEARKL